MDDKDCEKEQINIEDARTPEKFKQFLLENGPQTGRIPIKMKPGFKWVCCYAKLAQEFTGMIHIDTIDDRQFILNKIAYGHEEVPELNQKFSKEDSPETPMLRPKKETPKKKIKKAKKSLEEMEGEILSRMEAGQKYAKKDIVGDLSAGYWNKTINSLLEKGLVEKTGKKRGTRYEKS